MGAEALGSGMTQPQSANTCHNCTKIILLAAIGVSSERPDRAGGNERN